jgi:hypothetical protein
MLRVGSAIVFRLSPLVVLDYSAVCNLQSMLVLFCWPGTDHSLILLQQEAEEVSKGSEHVYTTCFNETIQSEPHVAPAGWYPICLLDVNGKHIISTLNFRRLRMLPWPILEVESIAYSRRRKSLRFNEHQCIRVTHVAPINAPEIGAIFKHVTGASFCISSRALLCAALPSSSLCQGLSPLVSWARAVRLPTPRGMSGQGSGLAIRARSPHLDRDRLVVQCFRFFNCNRAVFAMAKLLCC